MGAAEEQPPQELLFLFFLFFFVRTCLTGHRNEADLSPLLICSGACGPDALPREWKRRAFGSTAIQLYLLVSVAPVALVLDLHQCVSEIEAGCVTALFLFVDFQNTKTKDVPFLFLRGLRSEVFINL